VQVVEHERVGPPTGDVVEQRAQRAVQPEALPARRRRPRRRAPRRRGEHGRQLAAEGGQRGRARRARVVVEHGGGQGERDLGLVLERRPRD
jgi:hypothetical protein